MKYIFKKTGEEVEIERWAWCAIYHNGTELRQFQDKEDGTGEFHQIGEIDQENLAMFVLYKPEDQSKRIDIPFIPFMRLIHKYKNVKPFYLEEFVRVYMIGYKMHGAQSFMFILPDDRIILSPIEEVDLPLYDLTYPK